MNAWLRARHRGYVANPENFDRPWAKLAPRLAEFRVAVQWPPGWRYVATGRVPQGGPSAHPTRRYFMCMGAGVASAFTGTCTVTDSRLPPFASTMRVTGTVSPSCSVRATCISMTW